MYATIVRLLILTVTAPLWLPVAKALWDEIRAALAADDPGALGGRRRPSEHTLSGLVHKPRLSTGGGGLRGAAARRSAPRRIGRRGAF